jgi:hypothetical protein
MATRNNTPIERARQEARKMELDFAAVRHHYEQIKEETRAAHEHPNYIRQTAWAHFKAHSPGCWDFWRHGFYYSYRHRLAKGADYTVIPGYDCLAQTMAESFPEFATDDGTERLWEFLLSPYDRLPTAAECWKKALDRAWRAKKFGEGREWRGQGRMETAGAEVPF